LAKAAGLSLDYFTRVFHRSHGLSPRQWLVQQRLSYAVVLLQETPLRIGEIAQRLGYANPHLFSRQFSAFFGRSPRSFRS
jgi:AraC-like DNA-binding protein